jgi:hypothetical protein
MEKPKTLALRAFNEMKEAYEYFLYYLEHGNHGKAIGYYNEMQTLFGGFFRDIQQVVAKIKNIRDFEAGEIADEIMRPCDKMLGHAEAVLVDYISELKILAELHRESKEPWNK